MFTWYRQSVVCYAYLEDLDAAAVRNKPSFLGKSRWFTRGWTLQELIAPSVLVFYGDGWDEIRGRDRLVAEISKATGIDEDLFVNGRLSQYSIAQRMSWAAQRQTKRVEDEAYCLLGIFGVTMPMLYGEGKMAFIRLQEEIMRHSDDQSIFAWRMAETSVSGLLAPSAGCFEGAGNITAAVDESDHHQPFFLTNKGIQITLPVMETGSIPPFETMFSGGGGPSIIVSTPDSMIAVLNCRTKSGKLVALAMDRKDTDPGSSSPYHRINADQGPMYLSSSASLEETRPLKIIVRAHERRNDLKLWDKLRPTFFGIRNHAESEPGFKLVHTINTTTAEARGNVSAKLKDGGRGGAVFSNGHEAFGIFLGESGGDDNLGPHRAKSGSCWELVTGDEADVIELAHKFKYKDSKFLKSNPWLRKPLSRGEGVSRFYVSMVVRRRQHGYSLVARVQDNKGVRFVKGTVEDALELDPRKAKSYWEEIGNKGKGQVLGSRNLSAGVS
ncbi:hypothetical protein IMZ48_45605 [Candidatus Bathyarchaeota archaeon]|nr:hypothetical protein [Candidatus Bathyarchaeota archaeon]